jgi:hypothetical protein
MGPAALELLTIEEEPIVGDDEVVIVVEKDGRGT